MCVNLKNFLPFSQVDFAPGSESKPVNQAAQLCCCRDFQKKAEAQKLPSFPWRTPPPRNSASLINI